MTARPPDLSWEALVEVTGATVASERGALNAALAQIRESNELTDEELAMEIRHRAGVYRQTFPGMALTPTALSKHWERIPLEAPKPTYTEPTPSECSTCGGDKLVIYSTRPAENPVEGHVTVYEEFAPCPDCNTATVGYWRSDGTLQCAGPCPGEEENRMTEQLVIDRCPFCREDVLVEDIYMHEVTGWEQPRVQGGANAIHLRQRTGKKAHVVCVKRASKGHIPGQDPLF